MSISTRSGARRFQCSICLKYCNVLKREIRFALRLNAAKKKKKKHLIYQQILQRKVVNDCFFNEKYRKYRHEAGFFTKILQN